MNMHINITIRITVEHKNDTQFDKNPSPYSHKIPLQYIYKESQHKKENPADLKRQQLVTLHSMHRFRVQSLIPYPNNIPNFSKTSYQPIHTRAAAASLLALVVVVVDLHTGRSAHTASCAGVADPTALAILRHGAGCGRLGGRSSSWAGCSL